MQMPNYGSSSNGEYADNIFTGRKSLCIELDRTESEMMQTVMRRYTILAAFTIIVLETIDI